MLYFKRSTVCVLECTCDSTCVKLWQSGQLSLVNFLFYHMSSKDQTQASRVGNKYLYLPSPIVLGLVLVFWAGFIIAMRLETFEQSPLLFSWKYLWLNVVIQSPVQLVTLPLGKAKQTNKQTKNKSSQSHSHGCDSLKLCSGSVDESTTNSKKWTCWLQAHTSSPTDTKMFRIVTRLKHSSNV